MGRAFRITVMALVVVAALVGVFVALPDGSPESPTHDVSAADGSATPVTDTADTTDTTATGTTLTDPPDSSPERAAAAITVPALPTPAAASDGSAAGTGHVIAGVTTSNDGTGAATTASATDTETPAQPTPPAQPVEPTPPAQPTQPAPPTTMAVTAPTTPPTTKAPESTTAAPKTTKKTTTKAPSSSTKKPAATTTAPAKPKFGISVDLGDAQQVIVVTADSKGATKGTLTAWEQTKNGSWRIAHGPYPAWLGSQGIGPASEYAARTPQGTFTLTEAFGIKADPGTDLPYRRTGPNDWWVSDVNAASYNTWQTCAKSKCDFKTSESEHLNSIAPHYNYAVVMDVNQSPIVSGGGSAFFLHVTDHRPTAGCIAVEPDQIVTLLRWLDPAQQPRIATGIA